MPVSSEREALTKLIAAWESLPLGRYTVDEIQAWLIADMVPAIGNARAALEAALSLPQGAPEWQPIETCPCKKNATYLGFNKGGYFIFYASENKGERRFYLDEPDGIYRRTPTHWKPLGAPPASPDPEGL